MTITFKGPREITVNVGVAVRHAGEFGEFEDGFKGPRKTTVNVSVAERHAGEFGEFEEVLNVKVGFIRGL